MIDLMKRLAELDAQNPNIVQETNFERPETSRFKSRERNAGLDTEYQGATVTWGKNKSKSFPSYDEAERFKNNLERKYPGLKAQVLGEADGSDGTFNGHKIVANRKTVKGDFLVIQNKNDDSYEIHKYVGPQQSTTGYEFVSAHKTPEEMQAAFKNVTGVDEGNNQQDVAESSEQNLEECGMMDSMGSMSQPHTPASINMTAASGEELSGMLKDIMSLAGMSKDSEMPISTEPAAQTLEPAGPPEMDSTTIMRSVIDKMNPDDDEEDDEEEKVDEWDNEPAPETTGYDSMTPAGDDLHKQKAQYPAAQPGDNAMTMEQQLMAEYKKFISEEQE